MLCVVFWWAVFATGFVVDSVMVQGNKLDKPSKSFEACLCGSAQKS